MPNVSPTENFVQWIQMALYNSQKSAHIDL